MTTFIRSTYPFTVQASVDSSIPDIKVSTDGTVEIKALFVSAIVTPAVVSASVSVPVTAAGFMTFTDASGNIWLIPAFTTLA